MSENVWIAIIAAVLGGGGLGAAVVNALANRKKIQADCVATLSQAYETRINALNKRADELATKVDVLEAQVSGLRSALSDADELEAKREALIVILQQENADLQTQVDKLSKIVNNKDKRIRELEKQVKELTARLDAMNGNGDGD